MSRRFRWPVRGLRRRANFFPQPPSATQFIAVTGIPSAEAFGTANVTDSAIRPTGIASGGAFGTAALSAGPATVSPSGIGSAEFVGTAFFTSTFDLTRVHRTTRPHTGFELLAVARVPQPSGAPTFIVVDPIQWKGLSWVDELSKPQTLNASCSISSLTEPIVQRLRKMHELPTELWLYRDGQIVFAGPWIGWNVQQETITFQATGLLGYLKYMTVTSDLVFKQVDQFAIVKGLVDHWQNQSYGNFGISTAQIPASGVLRDATYKQKELHNILQRVTELGARDNGFDIEVDPTTREMNLWYPQQGNDRSSGEDAVVFDSLSVTSTNVQCSAAPGDVASDAYGTGTGTQDPAYASFSDPELLVKFGRTSVTKTFDGVSDQNTLNDHVKALQNARDIALLIPGPGVRTVADADLSSYNVGDTVSYQLHARLGIDGAFRVRKRTVTVSQAGVEKSALEFV